MVQLAELHQALAAASDPVSLIRAPGRRLRLRDRPSGDWAPGRHAPAVGRIGGAFCRGIVSLGNGPRHGSPDIVDYAKDGISNWRDFLATAAVVRSTLGISPSAWGRRKPDIGEMSAAVVACILQRGAEFNSAGGYLRGLTRKSEVGLFFGPILMAQISSRRRDNERA